MMESESIALPLGYTPIKTTIIIIHLTFLSSFFAGRHAYFNKFYIFIKFILIKKALRNRRAFIISKSKIYLRGIVAR